jgi:hypothetical protein
LDDAENVLGHRPKPILRTDLLPERIGKYRPHDLKATLFVPAPSPGINDPSRLRLELVIGSADCPQRKGVVTVDDANHLLDESLAIMTVMGV